MRHVHIMGVCGTFMAGIAAIASESGYRVTGSDVHAYPPMSHQLLKLGIELIKGYSEKHLELNPDQWIIGNVVSRGNPLIEALLDVKKPYISGPQWLAEEVLKDRSVIAVAGTHGKTTTSSMVAWILEVAGYEPGFLIGGVPKNFEVSARVGKGKYFVIEADEYDTSFFDKRSKFVHYRPDILVLNNLEFDHADIFPDLSAIETQFHHLVRTVPRIGRIIVGNGEALDRVLAKGCWSTTDYVSSYKGWQAKSIRGSVPTEGLNEFSVHYRGEFKGNCKLVMPGLHNQRNALTAIAAATYAGIDTKQAIDALSSFRGVCRRLDLYGSVAGINVYDDFAHHPTAIALTLDAVREKIGKESRLIAVLELRSNSMKMGIFSERLPSSLKEADLVLVCCGGLQLDFSSIFSALGEKVVLCDSVDHTLHEVVSRSCLGDHVVVMSNGDFGGLHRSLLNELQKRFEEVNSSFV